MLNFEKICAGLLILLLSTVGIFAAKAAMAKDQPAPILFVHGNGDTAALWNTVIWRFESNGYPRSRLFAIDFSNPNARDKDDVAQDGRSSTADQLRELSTMVEDVRRKTGAAKIVLIASSRGGYAVRNYLKNAGGAAVVSHAILAGTPNHGVVALDDYLVGNEFNGRGAFLTGLNSGPDEVVAGVAFLTIRSDKNDKYAQPMGAYVGLPGKPTNVSDEGPALTGARNIVLPGLDHREVAFHPKAFREMYLFLMGKEPARVDILPERKVTLNGKISGMTAGGAPTNLPAAGADVEVFEVSAATGERLGSAKLKKTVGADGVWGPFAANPNAYYEFVVAVPGQAVTHIYRSPFPRSSTLVHLRPGTFGKDDKNAAGVVYMSRPRGYYGLGRDTVLLDGAIPAALPPGVPAISQVAVKLEAPLDRPVRAVFNDERLTVRPWPVAQNHLTIAELHY